MPTNDASQIVVGANGKVLVAPVGTTAPATEIAAWPAGWSELGYISEDGVKPAPSMSVNALKAWQSFYAVRRVVTERDLVIEFTLMQWAKVNVILAFGGGTVTELSTGHYKYTPPSPEVIDERALGVEWTDGSKVYRWIIPRGMVVDLGETQLQRTDGAMLPVSFGIIGSGVTDPYYILSNDPAWA